MPGRLSFTRVILSAYFLLIVFCLPFCSLVFKKGKRDFPSGPVVKNPPPRAGDMSPIPHLGGSHVSQQLSPCATISDPEL